MGEQDDDLSQALFIAVGAVTFIVSILILISFYSFSFAAPYIAVLGVVSVVVLFICALLV